MFRTFLSCILTVICLAAACGSVLAEEGNPVISMTERISWSSLSQLAITILGLIVAVHLALGAFARPVQVANVPTFPKYMTSRGQYQLGRWMFVLFACGVFFLLIHEHQQVLRLADVWGEGLAKTFIGAIKDAATRDPRLI